MKTPWATAGTVFAILAFAATLVFVGREWGRVEAEIAARDEAQRREGRQRKECDQRRDREVTDVRDRERAACADLRGDIEVYIHNIREQVHGQLDAQYRDQLDHVHNELLECEDQCWHSGGRP